MALPAVTYKSLATLTSAITIDSSGNGAMIARNVDATEALEAPFIYLTGFSNVAADLTTYSTMLCNADDVVVAGDLLVASGATFSGPVTIGGAVNITSHLTLSNSTGSNVIYNVGSYIGIGTSNPASRC